VNIRSGAFKTEDLVLCDIGTFSQARAEALIEDCKKWLVEFERNPLDHSREFKAAIARNMATAEARLAQLRLS
jgi:hypothetical protein